VGGPGPDAKSTAATVPAVAGAPTPPLLAPRASDEYPPLLLGPRQRQALSTARRRAQRHAPRLGLDEARYLRARTGTAATLRAIDAAAGGGFYAVSPEAETDAGAADAAFDGTGPVVDVQTHLVRPSRATTTAAAALADFLRMVDPDR
jgi:hypothetical protein